MSEPTCVNRACEWYSKGACKLFPVNRMSDCRHRDEKTSNNTKKGNK